MLVLHEGQVQLSRNVSIPVCRPVSFVLIKKVNRTVIKGKDFVRVKELCSLTVLY